jgi:hypothetical protein
MDEDAEDIEWLRLRQPDVVGCAFFGWLCGMEGQPEDDMDIVEEGLMRLF